MPARFFPSCVTDTAAQSAGRGHASLVFPRKKNNNSTQLLRITWQCIKDVAQKTRYVTTVLLPNRTIQRRMDDSTASQEDLEHQPLLPRAGTRHVLLDRLSVCATALVLGAIIVRAVAALYLADTNLGTTCAGAYWSFGSAYIGWLHVSGYSILGSLAVVAMCSCAGQSWRTAVSLLVGRALATLVQLFWFICGAVVYFQTVRCPVGTPLRDVGLVLFIVDLLFFSVVCFRITK